MSSCPTTTWWARPMTGGRWPGQRWAMSAFSIGGGNSIFPSMDLVDLMHRHGDRLPDAAARVGAILTTDHALQGAQPASGATGRGWGRSRTEGNVTKLVLAEAVTAEPPSKPTWSVPR